jgi:flagellar biosynthesis protein FlhB
MSEYDAEKTIEPTPHRRQRARDEGHVAKSHDLVSATVLLLGLAALAMVGGGLVQALGGYFKQQLGGSAWLSADPQFIAAQWGATVEAVGWRVLPIFMLIAIAAFGANFAQAGFLFLPAKALPDFARLDPLQGVQRVFSLVNLERLLLGVVKIVVIVTVAYTSLRQDWAKIMSLTALAAPQIAAGACQIVLSAGLKMAVALVVLAILDYVFQRWKFERDLRMTPQELREEMKNLEGNRIKRPRAVGSRR